MESGNKTKKHIPAGAVLFMEGDPGGSGYYLESGKIEIWISRGNKRVPLAMLSDGEFVGELSAVDLAPRSASAVAVEDCVVVEFDHQQIANRIQAMDPVMRHLTGSLVDRIRSTNSQISDHFGNAERGLAKATIRRPVDLSCLDELTLETDLLKAAKNNEFELHFQPIIDIKRMKLAGFEALIRWFHPERGFVRPDQFIQFAEKNSIISNITRWCVEETCRLAPEFQLSALHNPKNVSPLFLAANLSARDVGCPEFGAWIEETITNSDCPPGMLKFEVTESSLMENMDVAKRMLNRLRELGVGIAIDDFGTGQSNLAYLNELPMTSLKMDRSLVTGKLDVESNQKAVKLIVKLVMGLAKDLGVSVVAEGIEDVSDLTMLQSLGCDYGQGYFFSKPLPVAEALQFARDWDARAFESDEPLAAKAWLG